MLFPHDSLSNRLQFLAFALILFGTVASCQKSTPVVKDIDACTLISQEEVQVIQGAPVKEVKSNANSNGGFRTVDCLYVGEVGDQSISLALIQKNMGSQNARDPKEYWKASFSRYAEQSKAGDTDVDKERNEGSKESEKEQENDLQQPKKINGLGDAAFWAPNLSRGGALYVLKGNSFIRIDIIGSENEESKIEKSKALAAKALGRL